MHFHRDKDETWYVLDGVFKLTTIDTATATPHSQYLRKGDVWRNTPLLPHQLHCVEGPGIIIEVSSQDTVEDNFRVLPGDSQRC